MNVPRHSNRDHNVTVLLEDKIVKEFSLPSTDPRFVKIPDLIEMAYSRALALSEEWDQLQLFCYGIIERIDRDGNPVRRLV
jgi:hypothetical protein